MSQEDPYELKPVSPEEKKPETVKAPPPKPGEPGWVEPVPVIEKAEETVDYKSNPPFDHEDVEKHRGLAILGYILFVIPLVLAPNSKFARFHANQGLLLFILWVVTLVVGTIFEVGWGLIGPHVTVTILSFFFGCISHIVPGLMFLGCVVMMIIGIVHAANGEKQGLPGIGQFQLIK